MCHDDVLYKFTFYLLLILPLLMLLLLQLFVNSFYWRAFWSHFRLVQVPKHLLSTVGIAGADYTDRSPVQQLT